jgi:TetR/AcrR family transcriptional regulator, regulator of cefoperazone and chloramphenicol sensitivity
MIEKIQTVVLNDCFKGVIMSNEEIKQKILYGTIECVEKYGLRNVTTRRITEMSGVNVAAINYHFGSKENLINAVLKITLDEGFVNNIEDYSEHWEKNTRHALVNYLKDTVKGMMNYPGLTRAHFSGSFNNNNNDSYSIQRLNQFLKTFHDLISNLMKTDAEKQQKQEIVQIWSALMLPGMMPGVFEEFLGYDLTDPDDQAEYIESILDHYLKK